MNMGEMRVRRKWSGQLVPILHRSSAHFELANVSASSELSTCAMTRRFEETSDSLASGSASESDLSHRLCGVCRPAPMPRHRRCAIRTRSSEWFRPGIVWIRRGRARTRGPSEFFVNANAVQWPVETSWSRPGGQLPHGGRTGRATSSRSHKLFAALPRTKAFRIKYWGSRLSECPRRRNSAARSR